MRLLVTESIKVLCGGRVRSLISTLFCMPNICIFTLDHSYMQDPTTLVKAAIRTEGGLSYLLEAGPADNAPMSPPSVNIEDTKASSNLLT